MRAQARSSSRLAVAGRADEHEVDLAVGQVVDARRTVLMPSTVLALQVGGEHLAAVAAGQHVVQRDEAELAGMRGRSRDHHAARLEQGEELRVGRRGPRPRRLGGARPRLDLHQRVDGDRAAVGRRSAG